MSADAHNKALEAAAQAYGAGGYGHQHRINKAIAAYLSTLRADIGARLVAVPEEMPDDALTIVGEAYTKGHNDAIASTLATEIKWWNAQHPYGHWSQSLLPQLPGLPASFGHLHG